MNKKRRQYMGAMVKTGVTFDCQYRTPYFFDTVIHLTSEEKKDGTRQYYSQVVGKDRSRPQLPRSFPTSYAPLFRRIVETNAFMQEEEDRLSQDLSWLDEKIPFKNGEGKTWREAAEKKSSRSYLHKLAGWKACSNSSVPAKAKIAIAQYKKQQREVTDSVSGGVLVGMNG